MSNIVIIGGSSGLGKEIAHIYSRKGVSVLPISRHTSPSLDLTNVTDESVANILSHTSDTSHLFLVAGIGYQGNLTQQSTHDIENIVKTAVTGPLQLMSKIVANLHNPIHMVTITSTTSFKVRNNETTYGAAKAGQAQLARNLHEELKRLIPNSKSTLIHPGGMQTPFWDDSNTDTTSYLNAADVAQRILDEVNSQDEDWREFSIIRQDDKPKLVEGTPSIQFP